MKKKLTLVSFQMIYVDYNYKECGRPAIENLKGWCTCPWTEKIYIFIINKKNVFIMQ